MSAPALSPKQVWSITASTTRNLALWVGAVSGGKTIASLFAFLLAVRGARGVGLIVIIGKTLQTIERNIIEPLQDPNLFGALAAQTIHTRGSSMATILGREVHLVGANDVRAEEKIRGGTIEIAYVDEATLLPLGFWEMLLTSLGTPFSRLLATTNPGSFNHWLRQQYILMAEAKNLVRPVHGLDQGSHRVRLGRQSRRQGRRQAREGQRPLAGRSAVRDQDHREHLA